MYFSYHCLFSLVYVGIAFGDGLNYRANRVHRYFGTSMNGGVPGNPVMNNIATNISDFGQYTCEYQMKWGNTEPQPNK